LEADTQEIRDRLGRIELKLVEHDSNVKVVAQSLATASERIADATERIERAVDVLSVAVVKLSNGNGMNGAPMTALVRWLAGAVVVAALGTKALDWVLSRVP
jgi:hypothetical protein